jgi:hypothetical protein
MSYKYRQHALYRRGWRDCQLDWGRGVHILDVK